MKEMSVHQSSDRAVSSGRIRTLGPNVIEGSIRTGTTAGVFSAHNTELDRPVAIKMFHPSYPTAKFDAEVGIHGNIPTDVSHVVPLLDYDHAHPNNDPSLRVVPYMVMERADGGNLMEVVGDRGKLGMRTGISLISRLAEPLDYIQKKGTPHSDVKPENILFKHSPKPGLRISAQPIWLADFGMAGPITADDGKVKRGFGTVTYAAPEQMADRRAPTTDQFGLAATLTVISLGERVIPILDERQYRKHVHSPQFGEYLDYRIGEFVPEPFQPAIRRAMDPDPERRYETSGAFAQDVADRHKEVMDRIHVPEFTIVDMGRGKKRP